MSNILFIDNFDSFTYNLVEEFEKRGFNSIVYRNNVPLKEIEKKLKHSDCKLIVLSPGPSGPQSAGNSVEIIKKYHSKMPILGICLGHQCIVEAFGGKVQKSKEIFHAKPSLIFHEENSLFAGAPQPFMAGRYHSLIATRVPKSLKVTAKTQNNIVMAVEGKKSKVIGLQFHPESILTPFGGNLIDNALNVFGVQK